MSTYITVNTYTHSVTYVSEKILKSVKDIIVLSGLSPEKLANSWEDLSNGIKTWLNSQDLQQVHLEVYNPGTDKLIGRWDFEIFYGYSGDGAFWVDTDAIRYHILKAGKWPSDCEYRILLTNKPGRPEVAGWSKTTFRSTDGLVRQSIGTTIDAGGLSSGVGYWRKK